MVRTPSDDPRDLGIYSPGMVGALAGASGQSIGQWARHGLIRPSVYKGRPANLYSYYDVAEAVVVKWLVSHDLTHRQIRLALADVRGDHPDWPLLRAPLGIGRLSVDDRATLVKRVTSGTYMAAGDRSRPEQVVLRPQLLEEARDMLATGGWVAAQRGLRHIEVRPLKMGGAPSLAGRRWSVDQVARLAADAEGRHVLTDVYGIPAEEVGEAVEWMVGARELASA